MVAGTDELILSWESQARSFSASAYRCFMTTGRMDANGERIWATKVPTKLKFFAWLFCNDRLPTRAKLLHKNILETGDASCPRGCGDIEDATHLFYFCPAARATWSALSIATTNACLASPWDCSIPPSLPAEVWDDILLMILWQLWTSRNDVVFQRSASPTAAVLAFLAGDIDLWSHRFSVVDKQRLNMWRMHVQSARMHCNL